MNVFRSLARELISLAGNEATKQTGEIGLRSALEKRVVPAVVDLGRYRDSFDRMPQNFSTAMNSLKGERAFTKSSWASLGMTAPEVSAPTAQPSFRVSSPAFASHLADGFESTRRSPVDLSGGLKPAASLAASAQTRSNGFTASLADL